MIWGFLGTLLTVGATIWSTVAQNKEREKAKQESLGFAERKFEREGDILEGQEGIARQKLELESQRIGVAKESLKETKRLNRGKQLLALLGAKSQLSQNMNDLWGQMGILGTGGA